MADDYTQELGTADPLMTEESLSDWVDYKAREWRNWYESNYELKHQEYYRMWRAIWSEEDQERASERSQLIPPAIQQAVESNVAEIEEATFGRGTWFDISDDRNDPEAQDIMYLRNKLTEDFEKTKVRKGVAEVLLNAAVYGTGIAEIVMDEVKEMRPATQPVMGGQLNAVGVEIEDRTVVKLKPVLPQNFLIEPVATCVEDAVGVAIEEFVSEYYVQELQEAGVLMDVPVGTAAPDTDLEPDQNLAEYQNHKVRLVRYYGKVPRELLEDEVEDGLQDDSNSSMVEAVVILANGVLVKAEENPYMMQDRPVVAFPWDVVPGRFWGRGICEKGYMSHKALQAELRARMDALALTTAPMMGVDATRLPRGAKPEVRPGKMVLTAGNPSEILQPFNFGQVNQITFAQAQALQQMVQQATGAVDSAGIAGQVNGEATAAGISMSLGAIIKRHKRTLINFQQGFLIPFVKKAAYRYMQFDPENYPVKDYKFNAASSLGIMAREYEVTQLTQLLQTMSPESPLYPALIQSIVDNLNLSNREELVETLKQAAQPDPQAQQMAQAQQQAAIEFQQAQTQAVQGQANESNARAQKYAAETQAIPTELEIKKIDAATDSLQKGDADDKEFEKRLRVAELAIREKEVDLKTKNTTQKPTGETNGNAS